MLREQRRKVGFTVLIWTVGLVRIAGAESEIVRDVVVYGSTPAAITAAISAQRLGKSTAIVSPETRIGGLTTGGLGQTDIGNKRAFGGLALQFYRDVAAYYRNDANWTWQKRNDYLPDGQCEGTKGADSMWTFEPHAALDILNRWEKVNRLKIYRGERLLREPKPGVVIEGGKIRSIKTLSGKTFRAKMFIDATYEGDLMAAAGVSYIVGREANSVYGETLNGCQPKQGWHRFADGVSPYVKAGDPMSGLLPGVTSGPIEPEGAGDSRVQAYCFRMCLTDVPENRIPFVKPANYDEREYELLLRNLEALEDPARLAAAKRVYSAGMPWINSKMPNRKTDTNNRMGVSTDFIGRNYRWAEASYEERERILKEHLDYQRGLMWTLANHPRVPASIRGEFARWGTCRDEFGDDFGDGWQRQLYVREARRMIGETVMTEKHCRHQVVAERPVGMAAYNMDSHHVRRYVDTNGFVRNEGDVEIASEGPYPIDYGAIVPKRGECANLYVPVCVSASHIAFGSIRMEPVFFALGQAAGTAAALAIDVGCAVQDLPYPPLSRQLLADGQILSAEMANLVEPLRTIMPYSLLYGGETGEDKLVDRLRAVAARSGIRRFVLAAPTHVVRVAGYAKPDEYERIGAKLARVNVALAAEGIAAGYLALPTVKCGINHPFVKIRGANGKESPISACPADPAFREYFVSNLTSVARIAKPWLIMIEDDFQPHIHPNVGLLGCFCERHIASFARRTGKFRTRAELYRLFHEMKDADSFRLRCEWDRMQCDDLKSLAASLSASVAGVSPQTRLALSAPGSISEPMGAEIALALAGKNHRPAIRFHGAHYGMDTPTDFPWLLQSAQWCRENLSPDIEFWHEADPCPHNPFFASAARMEAAMSSVFAMGFDESYFWGLSTGEDALATAADYLDMYGAAAQRFGAIRAEARIGRLVGMGVAFDPHERFRVPHCSNEPYECCSWYRVLARMGLPGSFGTQKATLYAGAKAFLAMDDVAVRKCLSGRVFLDGAAAESLIDRGYGNLVGLRHEPCDKVLFTGEYVLSDGARIKSAMHQNYGLDGCRVSRLLPSGAEELSVYFAKDPTNYVQSALTRYENRLGGRVAVLALDLRDAITANLFCSRKRELLVEAYEWLTEEELPLRVKDRANEMLLVREGKGRLMAHLVNLSCDVRESYRFAVSPRHAGKTVEMLDGATWREADFTWEGSTLTVHAKVPVYKTLVFRIL